MVFNAEKKEADSYTREKNSAFLAEHGLLPWNESNPEYIQITQDSILAPSTSEDFVIREEDGDEVIDLSQFLFVKQEKAPDSVNPSLWMAAKENFSAGVYGIIGRDVIQVRGIEVNTTLIRSKNGWILVDVPSSNESARAGIILAERALKENIADNIVAVILGTGISDLYGNARGGLKGAIGNRKIPIYASGRFGERMTEESTYSNVINMRKQTFQFGNEKPDPLGYVTTGFAMGVPGGSTAYTADHFIEADGTIEIDGIRIEVTLTHDIGTPAEMNLYFTEYKVLWVGECLLGMLHNIYTVRGAKPRNANAWSGYIHDLYTRYGDKAVAVLQSSNAPHKNTEKYPDAVREYLINSAAAYKWIHDQTLHYASKGYRVEEIASFLDYPEELGKHMYVRPYYGSIAMGVRGTYSDWMGNYDGNPVNLQKQTKEEEAAQFIEYVGSVERVFEKALSDYKNRKYQRAIEALDKIMFYDPSYSNARYLYADILEQLGYQAECATWRNAYLNGAKELREGAEKIVPNKDKADGGDIVKSVKNMPDRLMLDYLGIALDGNRAKDAELEFILTVKHVNSSHERNSHYLVTLRHGTLLHSPLKSKEDIENAKGKDIPEIKTLPGILTKLVSHDIDAVREYIETDQYEILKELEKYLDDPLDYLDYPIMEKRSEML
ncbi:MAG: hypothetical protein LUH14_00250 [Clostridiaceae bacterium]|nr:hypothetical protein [Clostridiaceae bacterium]